MTAPNNALLYNAAISGMVAGAVKGRPLTAKNSGTPPAIGTPDASYAALASQCTAFATELDGKLPNDHAGAANPTGTQAISVVTTGVAIVPSTGSIQMGQIGKVRLLESLALGVLEGRYYAQPTALTAAELSAVATLASDAYNVYAETYVQPFTQAGVNNQLLLFACFNGAIAGMLASCPDVSFDNNIGAIAVIATVAGALCTAVDTAIPNDVSISQAAGGSTHAAPQIPEPDATNIVQLDELGKYRLMHSIAFAAVYERSGVSMATQFANDVPAIAAWATQVAGPIVAAYNATKGDLITALPSGGTPLNPGLWNEAYAGFIAGNLAGRPTTSTSNTDPAYEALAAAAQAFANEVDTAVGAVDTSGTPAPTGTQGITVQVSEGIEQTYIVPTTGPIQEGELGKSGLMWAICRGYNHGRPLLGNALDTTSSTYATAAGAIVALYLELATVLLTP